MFQFDYFIKVFPRLLAFFPTTLLITGLSLLFALLWGLVLVGMKLAGNKAAKGFANGYTMLIRSTPVLLLLFLVYYGLPVLFGQAGIDISGLSKLFFVVVTFTVELAAYLSEDIKAAYLSVEGGQLEAALSVGMSKPMALLRIVVPQTVTVFIPNFGNSIARTLKETSLVYTIGMLDLIGGGNMLSAFNYGMTRLEIFVAISIIYWVSGILIDKSMGLFEKKNAKTRRGLSSYVF
jgi:L-cystine transport system permease protein